MERRYCLRLWHPSLRLRLCKLIRSFHEIEVEYRGKLAFTCLRVAAWLVRQPQVLASFDNIHIWLSRRTSNINQQALLPCLTLGSRVIHALKAPIYHSLVPSTPQRNVQVRVLPGVGCWRRRNRRWKSKSSDSRRRNANRWSRRWDSRRLNGTSSRRWSGHGTSDRIRRRIGVNDALATHAHIHRRLPIRPWLDFCAAPTSSVDASIAPRLLGFVMRLRKATTSYSGLT